MELFHYNLLNEDERQDLRSSWEMYRAAYDTTLDRRPALGWVEWLDVYGFDLLREARQLERVGERSGRC